MVSLNTNLAFKLNSTRYMPMKIITVLFVSFVLTACVHAPSYYSSLKEEAYTHGNAKFSDIALNSKTSYGSLMLREDGACSITETRDGHIYHGGGAWSKTDHANIIRIGLSSSSPMIMYHFYVRLYKRTNTYLVSDKLEALIEP